MAEYGPNIGGAAADAGSPGETVWVLPGNAAAEDASNATQALDGEQGGRYLDITEFGSFTGLGASDEITNIKVEVKGRSTLADASLDAVDLILEGTALGVNPTGLTFGQTTSWQTAIDDTPLLWGFNPGQLLGSNCGSGFGIRLRFFSSDVTTIQVDAVRVTLTATAGSSYTLTAETGSFALTGNNAGLIASRLLQASAGSFALTGNNAALLASRSLVCSAGSFAMTGNDASLLGTRILTASAGSFSLTGNAAGLLANRVLACSVGSFAMTGNDAELTYTPNSGGDGDANAEIAAGFSVNIGIGF